MFGDKIRVGPKKPEIFAKNCGFMQIIPWLFECGEGIIGLTCEQVVFVLRPMKSKKEVESDEETQPFRL